MRLKVALFSPHLEHIGETRSIPKLAQGLAQNGWQIDLLETWEEWEHVRQECDAFNVRLVCLRRRYLLPVLPRLSWLPKWLAFRVRITLLALAVLPPFIVYLRRERPQVLIVRLLPTVALWAKRLSKSPTKVIISLSGWPRPSTLRKFLWRLSFSQAEVVTVPVEDMIAIVERLAKVHKDRIHIVPDPVLETSFTEKAKEPLHHPWFQPGEPPVILGVGRLTRQKDFAALLRAFAIVHQEMPARLMILGEGEERKKLERLAQNLGIAQDVALPGFVDNPYKYMARASVFVLSSRWEGPGHVLVEALALGIPIVATDCPYGPREILLDGKAGMLVPVGDHESMAKAILELLRNPIKAKQLVEEGVRTAARYYVDASVQKYLSILDGLVRESK
jgi:glycosyltransferase involved in cell wall biosynthesis